jgi:hypothetical protein
MDNAARFLGEPTMRHLLLWLIACVLTSSVVTAKPAWVDPDIIRAYEKVTGESYAAEVVKLTGVELPSSGDLESPRIGSDSSRNKALQSNERIRGIVRRTAEETLIRCTIIFVGDTTALTRLGQRIDFRVNDSTGFITFPVDLLPALSVLEGMKELYLGGAQEFYKPDRATLIDGGAKTEDRDSDSGTTQQSSGTLTAPKDTKMADSKPAWVEPDIVKAYEWATGKNYADEIAKLTGVDLPSSETAESARIGSDSSKSKALGTSAIPRGIVRLTDGEKLIGAYITLAKGGAYLGSLDLRIDRWVNDSQGTITFPVDVLPQLSVLKGVRELFLGGVQEIKLNYSTPMIDGHTSKPAWVDPNIVRAYEKVTGKSYTEEVAKLTGTQPTPGLESKGKEYGGQEKTAAAEEFDYRSVPGVVEHNDGIYLHVHLKFDGDVRELESLDPRIYVNRMGDKVSRAGNVITVRFPIELLPEISCATGVRSMRRQVRLGLD